MTQTAVEMRKKADEIWAEAVTYETDNREKAQRLKNESSKLHEQALELETKMHIARDVSVLTKQRDGYVKDYQLNVESIIEELEVQGRLREELKSCLRGLGEKYADHVVKEIVEANCEIFSIQDLRILRDFYRSPTGTLLRSSAERLKDRAEQIAIKWSDVAMKEVMEKFTPDGKPR